MNSWHSVRHVGETAHVQIGDWIGCWNSSATDLLNELAGAADVQLVINSCGGDGRVATQLFDALRGRVSQCVITGRGLSSAVVVDMAAEHISIVRGSRIMIHQPCAAILGQAANLRQTAVYLDTLTARWLDLLSPRVGSERAREWIESGVDQWFDADEALKLRLVDKIVDPPPVFVRVAEDGPAGFAKLDDDDGAERLLLDFLGAIGQVQTKDRAKLVRELGTWASVNIRSI